MNTFGNCATSLILERERQLLWASAFNLQFWSEKKPSEPNFVPTQCEKESSSSGKTASSVASALVSLVVTRPTVTPCISSFAQQSKRRSAWYLAYDWFKESKEDLKTWLTPQQISILKIWVILLPSSVFCADVLKQTKTLFLQPLQSVVRRRRSFFSKLDRSLALCHTVTRWKSADYPSSTSPRFSSHLAGRFPLRTLSRRCSNYQERGSWSP